MTETRLKPGDNTTRGTIPANAQDARERGLREDGLPLAPGQPGNNPGGGGAGVNPKDLVALILAFLERVAQQPRAAA